MVQLGRLSSFVLGPLGVVRRYQRVPFYLTQSPTFIKSC